MRYRYLGSSGLLISRITLGTMTFGAPDWGCDEREAHAILKRFLWKALEQQTRPEEEYTTWFNRKSYERFFAAADFHDERAELP